MKPAHPVTIGLFGTCDNSKWRDAFMESYEINDVSYFNPDAGDNWHPGLIEQENENLRTAEIILFPVLGESLGLGSLGELGFSILNVKRNIEDGSNQHLIVMIDDECTSENATESEKNHSNRTRKLVKSKLLEVTHKNILIVDSLDSMLLASYGIIEANYLHDEAFFNFDIRQT